MRLAAWLAPIAVAASMAAALAVVPPGWIVAADAALETWRPALGALRAGGIVSAWLWWDRLVGAVPGLPAEAATHLRERRHLWCGTLAAVELVLVRNVFGALWRLVA